MPGISGMDDRIVRLRKLLRSGTKRTYSVVLLGVFVGVVGGLHGTVCWTVVLFGDCFEEGSLLSILGGVGIGTVVGTVFGFGWFRARDSE